MDGTKDAIQSQPRYSKDKDAALASSNIKDKCKGKKFTQQKK